jgi:ribosome-associated translation inhibitor RaiA
MQIGERTPGSRIETAGFKDLEKGVKLELDCILVKWATRFSEICTKFEVLKVQMKRVHGTEKSEKYEVHVRVQDEGAFITATATERNLFSAVNAALRKAESEIQK